MKKRNIVSFYGKSAWGGETLRVREHERRQTFCGALGEKGKKKWARTARSSGALVGGRDIFAGRSKIFRGKFGDEKSERIKHGDKLGKIDR